MKWKKIVVTVLKVLWKVETIAGWLAPPSWIHKKKRRKTQSCVFLFFLYFFFGRFIWFFVVLLFCVRLFFSMKILHSSVFSAICCGGWVWKLLIAMCKGIWVNVVVQKMLTCWCDHCEYHLLFTLILFSLVV